MSSGLHAPLQITHSLWRRLMKLLSVLPFHGYFSQTNKSISSKHKHVGPAFFMTVADGKNKHLLGNNYLHNPLLQPPVGDFGPDDGWSAMRLFLNHRICFSSCEQSYWQSFVLFGTLFSWNPLNITSFGKFEKNCLWWCGIFSWGKVFYPF